MDSDQAQQNWQKIEQQIERLQALEGQTRKPPTGETVA